MGKHPNLHLVECDLTDSSASIRLLQTTKATEVYNFAVQSFVGVSLSQPATTVEITGIDPLNLLEAIRIVSPEIRLYRANASEMFNKVQVISQTRSTPFHPCSPYGVVKLYAYWTTVNYCESYNIFDSSGILFDHESPLRGREFVTCKITDSLTKIHLGKLDVSELGSLDAKRNWGSTEEYVEGMWRMLQTGKPDTCVLATSRTKTVRGFVAMVARTVGTEITWEGHAGSGVGHDRKANKAIAKINPKFYRLAKVELLIGNPAKTREGLGWEPKTTLEQLCRITVEADVRRNQVGFSF